MKVLITSVLLSLCCVGCVPGTGGDVDYSAHVEAISESTFEWFLQSEVAVVDFWAAWCGPCIKMKPIFSDVAETYAGKAKFGAVDVDRNSKLAQKYNVRAIPTILIFKNGVVVDTLVGMASKAELGKRVEAQL